MAAVRSFKVLTVQKGRYFIIKDTAKYGDELGLQLQLSFPYPVVLMVLKLRLAERKVDYQQGHANQLYLEKWQGKLIKNRWDDEKAKPEKCFIYLAYVMEKRVDSYHNRTTRTLPAAVTHKDIYMTTERQKLKSLMQAVVYLGNLDR